MKARYLSCLSLLGILQGSACAEELRQHEIRVASGETLFRIASRIKPDEQVATVQVIYALWQANQAVFAGRSVHALPSGSILKRPSRQEMLSTPVSSARRWYYQALEQTSPLPAQISNASRLNTSVAVKTQETTVNATSLLTVANHPSSEKTDIRSTVNPTVNDVQSTAPARASAAKTTEDANTPAWYSDIEADYTLELQQRYYPRQGDQGQQQHVSSAAFTADWYWQSSDRHHNLALQPYARWDQHDSERSLFDLRQAYWQYVGDGFDVKAGIDIVFWGVTESQHLVDVINQTDLPADIDGETKLGQPMLNWNLYGDAGTLSLFVLPYFRERPFVGVDGRLRPPLLVEQDKPLYESSQRRRNIDFALRWSRQFGATDLALSYFEGNSREPVWYQTETGTLQPLYLQMQQLGLEALKVSGSWLWKLESVYRKTRQQDWVALTAGVEYTWVGLAGTDWDLGWIAEYQYDSRDQYASSPGQNDVFIGTRFIANDEAGSEILFGFAQDLDNSDSQSGKLEASMRLTNSLRLQLDAWFFRSNTATDPLFMLQHDDYLQLSLSYYF